jgi:ADP-ribose pyrophosphatase
MPHDGEDIRVLVVPWRDAKRQLGAGGYGNAATIIALQWLALNRTRLRRAWGAATEDR